MNRRIPDKELLQHLGRPGIYSIVLASAWTAIVAISLLVASWSARQEMVTVASNVANAYIEKDILFREWVAKHGGIYVEISPSTPPNPRLLPHMVPERDITTPSGKKLTLVNPAYLTYQLYELSKSKKQIAGHITSLKPLNPDNLPDEWERNALLSFENGSSEFKSVFKDGKSEYLRLMRPLVTDEDCLRCHREQGYRIGDIRGGISVRLSMEIFKNALTTQSRLLWLGHSLLWTLGILGLYIGYRLLKLRIAERDRAQDELQRINLILENQATTDLLTGLYNRRKLLNTLERDIHLARRTDIPLALIFFDIDHFKVINDSFGHDTGDLILREMADLISGLLRKNDLLARYGGEEFIILANNNNIITALLLAEKVRKEVEQHNFPVAGTVTCSFGVAQLLPDESAESLINRADMAMYAAKERGRNRVEAADSQATVLEDPCSPSSAG